MLISGRMTMKAFGMRVFVLGIFLGLISCGGPEFTILNRPVSCTAWEQDLLHFGSLTPETKSTLKREDLLKQYRRDPNGAILALAERYKSEPNLDRRLAVVEMLSDQGDQLKDRDPMKSLGYYLDIARICEEEALKPVVTVCKTHERLLFEHATKNVAQILQEKNIRGKQRIAVSGVFRSFRLGVAEGENYVNPADFETLVPSNRVKIKGLDVKRVQNGGDGFAMLGRQETTPERKEKDPARPKGALGFPLNARITFSGSDANLVLQDLMLSDVALVEGKEKSLEADFTAALTSFYFQRKTSYSGFRAMLRPDLYAKAQGMYSVEPFRDDKIPLILVHGLQSSAEAWVPFLNSLRADPLMRESYQVYLFNYPTGKAVAKNAADLRQALRYLQQSYDPGGKNPYMRKMVIVGHSMGGVISNMQIRNSGNLLYDSVVDKPIEELELSDERKESIKSRAFFVANEDIERAVLIAAPLRGSSFAANPIGRLGAALIRLPLDFTELLLGNVELVSSLTESGQSILSRPRNSINSLRPGDPILLSVLEMPVRKGVKIHSIMGQANEDAPKEEGTDRLVQYTSARLEEAVSEKVVLNTNHVSVVESDECVEEVTRILYLHIGKKMPVKSPKTAEAGGD